MPKNNKRAVGRTVLFVLLAAAMLVWGEKAGQVPFDGAELSGFVKEVVSWVVSVPEALCQRVRQARFLTTSGREKGDAVFRCALLRFCPFFSLLFFPKAEILNGDTMSSPRKPLSF